MTTTTPRSMARLYWLALGTFAIGTEGFMIAPLLPDLARDLSVSLASAGQLVTVFALTYALSSPVLTALTGDFDRRRLLIASMLAFAAANFVALSAHSYSGLLAARILLAVAAGLYVPNANALANALVEASHRGTALSIVTGGTSVAVALGVPLGALVGDHFGWRVNFAAVGVLALIATAGLLSGLPRNIAERLPVASLRERLDVARQPAVLLALLSTMLWATGAFTVYTYLASFLARAAGIDGIFRQRRAVHVGRRGRDRSQARRAPDRPLRTSAGHCHELVGVGACLPEPVDECRLVAAGSSTRADPAGDRPVGRIGVVVLPGPAGAAYQHRRREGGAGRTFAERIVPVLRLFIRCGSRLADRSPRLAPGARLGRCGLRDRGLVARGGHEPPRAVPVAGRGLTRTYRRLPMSKDHTGAEQGARTRSLRHAVQQARL